MPFKSINQSLKWLLIFSIDFWYYHLNFLIPCLWGFKYADCIPWRGVTPPLKKGVLGMTLHYIWWWSSSSGYLRSVECLLLPPKTPFLTWPWEQTSCLLCELRGNFSLPFDLGHFEYYLAWLIVCSSLAPLLFELRLLLFWSGDTGVSGSLVRMIPASNRVRCCWAFLRG